MVFRMSAHPNSLKNLIRTGRPSGAVGKRTKLLRRLDPEVMDLSLTPKEAMAKGMAYFERKAQELLNMVEKARADGIPISETGPEMKLIKEYQEAMIDCAAKLAPYIHPRLAAVEVRTEQVQPFVVRVPAIDSTSQTWADRVAGKIIDAEPTSSTSGGCCDDTA